MDNKGFSILDHEIYILPSNERYCLPRGTLKGFRRSSRDDLELKLQVIMPRVFDNLHNNDLTLDSIRYAIVQACLEEEHRVNIEEAKENFKSGF